MLSSSEPFSKRIFRFVQRVKGGWRRVPIALKKSVEDRIFYAIFQSTRVTNDAYGWRPEEKQSKD